MAKHQAAKSYSMIKTPKGEELVILSKAEYDALISRLAEAEEDAADLATYDIRKGELVESDTLPPEISAAVLKGDRRVKAIRAYREMSQIELSKAAGIGQGFLSDLESGRRRMTDAVAEKLAMALNVPLDWLR